MVRFRLVAVVFLVVLVGCTAPQADEPRDPAGDDVTVTLSNEHNVTYTVDVHAIPPDAERIELTYKNGSTRTVDGLGDDLPGNWLRNVTALSVDGSDQSQTVTLAPNRGVGLTLEAVPPGSSVVYLVRSEAGLRATHGPGIVQCGSTSGRVDLMVTILADGSLDSRLSCVGETAVAE